MMEKALAQAPTIDTHAHYFPQSYIDLIAKLGPRCGTTVAGDAQGRTFIQVGLLLRTGPITPTLWARADLTSVTVASNSAAAKYRVLTRFSLRS